MKWKLGTFSIFSSKLRFVKGNKVHLKWRTSFAVFIFLVNCGCNKISQVQNINSSVHHYVKLVRFTIHLDASSKNDRWSVDLLRNWTLVLNRTSAFLARFNDGYNGDAGILGGGRNAVRNVQPIFLSRTILRPLIFISHSSGLVFRWLLF